MYRVDGRGWGRAAVATAAVLLGSCGGGGDKTGGGPPTVPVDPVPTPIAAPTPDPPLSQSCTKLPLGSANYKCRGESPTFLREVSAAIDELKQARPEFFHGDSVTNVGGYYVGVVKILDQKGLCAGFDGEELAVKNAPDFNDQYDIMTAEGRVRKAYIGTCYPAVFPLAAGEPGPSPAGCNLPPSREIACGRPEAQYFDVVDRAVGEVLSARPELFDTSKVAPGRDWPAVKNMEQYHDAVVQVLARQGYCAKFDGEEIQVKRTNEFTEHYDINFADQYIRRGPGIYRVACYPAAF